MERDNPFGLVDRAAHEVTAPSVAFFAARRTPRASLLIIPGGGYRWVVIDKEGFEGARWFSRAGLDVYVLRYRLPHQGWATGPDAPLADAARAVAVIRAHARSRSGPSEVWAMGFSAGGHLAGRLAAADPALLARAGVPDPAIATTPDLVSLIYPVTRMVGPHVHAGSRTHLLGEAPSADAPAAHDLVLGLASAGGPRRFVMHSLDDAAVPVENSIDYAQGARAAGISCVLHLFETGGHGFGLRGIAGTPRAAWPELFLAWTDSAPPG